MIARLRCLRTSRLLKQRNVISNARRRKSPCGKLCTSGGAQPTSVPSTATRIRPLPRTPAPRPVRAERPGAVGHPCDGHTLGDVVEATERLTGCGIERAYVGKGCRGHNTQNPRRFFISGKKRGVFGVIKRELRRRSAIEPVIGHMKTDGHLGRCRLKGRKGMRPTLS